MVSPRPHVEIGGFVVPEFCRPLFVEALLRLPMFLSAGLAPVMAFQGEVGAVVDLPRSLGDLGPVPLMLKKQRPGLRRVPGLIVSLLN